MSFDDSKCLYKNACLVKFADDNNNPVIGVRGLDDPGQIIIEGIFKWCIDHNFIVNTLKLTMRFNFKKKYPSSDQISKAYRWLKIRKFGNYYRQQVNFSTTCIQDNQ